MKGALQTRHEVQLEPEDSTYVGAIGLALDPLAWNISQPGRGGGGSLQTRHEVQLARLGHDR